MLLIAARAREAKGGAGATITTTRRSRRLHRKKKEKAEKGLEGPFCTLSMVSAPGAPILGALAQRGPSVRVRRHFRTAATDEEVEVAAFVGLQHVFDIQVTVAGRILRVRLLRFLPFGKTRDHFLFVDIEVQLAGIAIELDPV